MCQSLERSLFRAKPSHLVVNFHDVSAVLEVICGKLTSHPKHRTAGNSFFSYFVFSKFAKKVVAQVFKILVFSEI